MNASSWRANFRETRVFFSRWLLWQFTLSSVQVASLTFFTTGQSARAFAFSQSDDILVVTSLASKSIAVPDLIFGIISTKTWIVNFDESLVFAIIELRLIAGLDAANWGSHFWEAWVNFWGFFLFRNTLSINTNSSFNTKNGSTVRSWRINESIIQSSTFSINTEMSVFTISFLSALSWRFYKTVI